MLCLSLFSTLPFRALGVLINERYRHGFYVRVPYHRHYMRIYAQALLCTCPKRNTSPIQYRLFYSGVVISRETKKKKLRVLPLATLRPRCAWQFLFVDFRVAKWWNIWWWIRGAWSRATHLSRNNTNINRRGETVSSFVPSHRLAVRPYIYHPRIQRCGHCARCRQLPLKKRIWIPVFFKKKIKRIKKSYLQKSMGWMPKNKSKRAVSICVHTSAAYFLFIFLQNSPRCYIYIYIHYRAR